MKRFLGALAAVLFSLGASAQTLIPLGGGSSGSSSLVVGTTTITGGTTGRVLYDNAGVVGEALLTYSAASLQLGTADVASGAVAQLLTAQGNTGSTVVGPDFTIRGPGGGSSTAVGGKLILMGGLSSAAAGTGGAIEFWTAPAAAGNAAALALSISSAKQATFASSVTAVNFLGTTGSIWILDNSSKISLGSSSVVAWTSTSGGGTADLILARDAANTLALRNGTAAQTSLIYRTWTNASTYERAFIAWDRQVGYLSIGTEDNAGGARNMRVGPVGAASLYLTAGGVDAVAVASNALTFADAVDMPVGTTTGTKIATATSQKLGFWNTTPIVQPTTAVAAATVAGTGAGYVIAASTTFDGYTMPQVVKALRNAGLLQ